MYCDQCTTASLETGIAASSPSRMIRMLIFFSLCVRACVCLHNSQVLAVDCPFTSDGDFFLILYPVGKARIRVQLSAVHTTEDVNRCVDAFIEIGKQKNVI